MKSQILSSTLNRLTSEQEGEWLKLGWQQTVDTQCSFSLPLPVKKWQQVTLLTLADVETHATKLNQASQRELFIIDCDVMLHLQPLDSNIHSRLADIQSDADIFCANLSFCYRNKERGKIADIIVNGPGRLFVSLSPYVISGFDQFTPHTSSLIEPRHTPCLTLKTNCPHVYIDEARPVTIRQVDDHRLYELVPRNMDFPAFTRQLIIAQSKLSGIELARPRLYVSGVF